MAQQMTGKVTHVGEKNGKVDSILLNCSLGKTLTVPFNDKTFGGVNVQKGNLVEFTHEGIFEVDFEDVKTGEVKPGSYLEADDFKFLSQREPEIRVHRKKLDLTQPDSQDAPHPADTDADPAAFNV